MADRNEIQPQGFLLRFVEIASNVYAWCMSLGTYISGEEEATNRMRVELKADDSDSILETMQNAAAATGNGTAINVRGYKAVTLALSGTFTATVTFEATVDDTNWFGISLAQCNGSSSSTITGTATTALAFAVPSHWALSQIRARVSSYTSGNVTVVARKHVR